MPGVEERVAQNVVTSENREAFMAHKLDLEKPAPAPEPQAGEKKPEAKLEEKKEEKKIDPPADEEQDDEVKEVKKRNPKIEQRFSDLTKARKTAEEEAVKAREEVKAAKESEAKARQEAAELRGKYEAPKPLGDKPKMDDFANPQDFAKALEDYTEKKTRADVEQQNKDAARKKTFGDWVEATKKELPDYTDKLNAAADVMLPGLVTEEIYESEIGPKLLYHYATHPEEAANLRTMTPQAQLRSVGRLEERLSKPAPKEEKKEEKVEVKSIAEISKAPEPIKPLKGGSGAPDVPVDSSGNFTGTPKQYRELRKAGKIK